MNLPALIRRAAAVLTGSARKEALREANERLRQEITARQKIEEALRNSERRFRSVWENSPEPMRLTDSQGTVLAANAAYGRLTGRGLDELLERPFTEAYAPEQADEKLAAYRERFESRRSVSEQLRKVTLRSGRVLDLEVSYSFLEGESGGPLLLAILRDVTERVETLQKLREAKEFSENLIHSARRQEEQRLALERKLLDSQKLESLGVLAGGIAHDFNNLLAAILGNTNLAQMKVPAESVAGGYLKNIEKTSLRAADLCKQMLAYSGRGRFSMQHIDVNDVVRETLELLEVSITKKAALRVELRQGLAPVHADVTQLRQVIMNLVINASEAIGEQTGTIRVRTGVVRASAEYFAGAYMTGELAQGDYIFVEVSDTGCGMNHETQKRIFDPFFTTKFTGRGLGLAAVLGIVRGHNGALKITSQPGKGSAFKFLLPASTAIPRPAKSNTPNSSRASKAAATCNASNAFNPSGGSTPSGPAAANAPNGPELHSPGQPAWQGQGTILVVDDDPTVRAVTARIVEACGFDVLQAVDGRHGVQVFHEHQERIRAVVLDMTMPNLNGREAFEAMRQIQPQVKVLLVSGFSEYCTAASFGQASPHGFLQKPYNAAELKEQLRTVLNAAAAGSR